MKKNNGFTLAETLITLGIIGVVASLTLPSLNLNIQKAQTGPALMKAINTLQNALSLGMTQQNLRNLNNFTTVKDVFEDTEKGPLAITLDYYEPFVNNEYNYYNADKTNFGELSSNNARIYTTKDGIDYILPNNGENPVNQLPAEALSNGFFVYIDINGHAKNPNILGKDTFMLFVDATRNFVIPYGGYEYAKTTAGSTTAIWEDDCNSTVVSDGGACTGSIFDNGGKVIYKY